MQSLLGAPEHPYTWGLLESMPRGAARDARLHPIPGQPPSLISVPRGCSFHPRCPHAFAVCPRVEPPLLLSTPGHTVACHLAPALRRRIGGALGAGAVRMEEAS